jgi:hypothetical protein
LALLAKAGVASRDAMEAAVSTPARIVLRTILAITRHTLNCIGTPIPFGASKGPTPRAASPQRCFLEFGRNPRQLVSMVSVSDS